MKQLLAAVLSTLLFLSVGCDRFGRPRTLDDISQNGLIQQPIRNRAVLWGINKYPSYPLNGCVNDVLHLRQKLIEKGFKAEEITMLLDEAATKEAIMAACWKMAREVTPGSMAFVGGSSHGTQVPAYGGSGGEIDGLYEVICPIDFGWTIEGQAKNGITDKELIACFRSIPKGVYFNWTSDSCHSGDLTRVYTKKSRAFPIPPFIAEKLRIARAENPRSKMKEMINGVLDVGFISGCRSDQTSADAYIDGQSQGAFTYYFLQAWNEHDTATAAQLAAITRAKLKAAGYDQRPQAEGARADKPLLK